MRPMRLFVIGASGKTGKELVSEGLRREHHITAIVRAPLRTDAHPRLQVVVGIPSRVDDLIEALPGHDAVLSVVGSRGLGHSTVRADIASATTAAMQTVGIKRLVILSSALVDPAIGGFSGFAARTFLKNVAADQRHMEEVVQRADLDWSLLRPAQLSNRVGSGSYEVAGSSDSASRRRGGISRAHLAEMMLDIVEQNRYIRQVVYPREAQR